MVYSFVRIGAALGMTVEDVFTQNRRLWVRLREKGGKRHAMPCHHNLEEYLTAYLDGAGLRVDPKGPLFRTIGSGTGKILRGLWNEDLFRVLEGFPDLAHDDEVDACSGALEMLNPEMNSRGLFEFYRREAEKMQAEHEVGIGAPRTHICPRLHGMARRAEQIELNRSSCAEMYARVLAPLRVHGAKTKLTLAGGTEGSNPSPSSGESTTNCSGPGADSPAQRWLRTNWSRPNQQRRRVCS